MSDGDGRARRAQETREARRQQILDTALRVFSARGYHGTNISDLVEAAGVARGTFYLYFESKDGIFRELLDQLLAQLRASVQGVDLSEGAPPIQDQLQRIVVRVLATVQDNRALTRIIFREAVGLDAEVDARLRGFYGELLGFLEASLRAGRALGAVRPLEVPVVARCILGSLRGVVQAYVVESDAPFEVDHVARAVVEYNLGGITARPG